MHQPGPRRYAAHVLVIVVFWLAAAELRAADAQIMHLQIGECVEEVPLRPGSTVSISADGNVHAVAQERWTIANAACHDDAREARLQRTLDRQGSGEAASREKAAATDGTKGESTAPSSQATAGEQSDDLAAAKELLSRLESLLLEGAAVGAQYRNALAEVTDPLDSGETLELRIKHRAAMKKIGEIRAEVEFARNELSAVTRRLLASVGSNEVLQREIRLISAREARLGEYAELLENQSDQEFLKRKRAEDEVQGWESNWSLLLFIGAVVLSALLVLIVVEWLRRSRAAGAKPIPDSDRAWLDLQIQRSKELAAKSSAFAPVVIVVCVISAIAALFATMAAGSHIGGTLRMATIAATLTSLVAIAVAIDRWRGDLESRILSLVEARAKTPGATTNPSTDATS